MVDTQSEVPTPTNPPQVLSPPFLSEVPTQLEREAPEQHTSDVESDVATDGSGDKVKDTVAAATTDEPKQGHDSTNGSVAAGQTIAAAPKDEEQCGTCVAEPDHTDEPRESVALSENEETGLTWPEPQLETPGSEKKQTTNCLGACWKG